MRTFLGLGLTVLTLAALASYGVWTTQRPTGHYLSDLRVSLAVNQGQPAGHGNLLGLETVLYPTDYQDLERLHRKLAAWLQQARDQGLVNDKTLVVLPEHIGTWLFAAGEKNEFYQADRVETAMDWLVWSNPLSFITALLHAHGEQRLNDTLLRMKARTMASDYQRLFGGLAQEFGITLVAGSIVLPAPYLKDGQLRPGTGALYNVSLVFGRDGQPLGPPQRQLHVDRPQRGYIQSGGAAPLQVFDTPAGRLGVLIGSDGLQAENYARLNQAGAMLIAVPAFLPGKNTPAQSLPLDSSHHAGLSVFMRGQFWNVGGAGSSFVHHDEATPLPVNDTARLINLWL